MIHFLANKAIKIEEINIQIYRTKIKILKLTISNEITRSINVEYLQYSTIHQSY
jgi:hypothetical protein